MLKLLTRFVVAVELIAKALDEQGAESKAQMEKTRDAASPEKVLETASMIKSVLFPIKGGADNG